MLVKGIITGPKFNLLQKLRMWKLNYQEIEVGGHVHVRVVRTKGYSNPFLANVAILYPLKTPENLSFCGVFRWHKVGTFARNGLRLG